MESALQSTLETFGVSAKGIAKMEVDGVTDEASLKAKVNERIAEGWQPYGTPFAHAGQILQALALTRKAEKPIRKTSEN